jgi:hypothetical protein
MEIGRTGQSRIRARVLGGQVADSLRDYLERGASEADDDADYADRRRDNSRHNATPDQREQGACTTHIGR